MVESLLPNRVQFNNIDVQKKFILLAKVKLNLSWAAFAEKLNINIRTLTSWANGQFKMPEIAAKKISKLTGVKIPKPYSVITWDQHLKNISALGGKSSFIKHGKVGGDQKQRKKKWQEWWEKTGQYKTPAKGYQTLLKIKKPRKSKHLAEFVGIMLGDGGVNAYYTSVTLSNKETKYIVFVSRIINRLFGILPKVYPHSNAEAVKIIVNRKEMVDFCQSIGLVQGDKIKQQIDIPSWVKENPAFARECIRGLVDTDGCFYTNSYISHGKKYSYFKIAFVSASLPLIKSVAEILTNEGIKARISKNSRDVRIEEEIYVKKYIQKIGSHNQKHLDKISVWQKSSKK